MYRVNDFIAMTDKARVHCYRRGWIPAKPLAGPFINRLKDAWAVLLDKAVAVKFDDPVPVPPTSRFYGLEEDQNEARG